MSEPEYYELAPFIQSLAPKRQQPLVETAKTNSLEPSIYIEHVLERIAKADTLEKLEALLPWNVDLERASKNVSQID